MFFFLSTKHATLQVNFSISNCVDVSRQFGEVCLSLSLCPLILFATSTVWTKTSVSAVRGCCQQLPTVLEHAQGDRQQLLGPGA